MGCIYSKCSLSCAREVEHGIPHARVVHARDKPDADVAVNARPEPEDALKDGDRVLAEVLRTPSENIEAVQTDRTVVEGKDAHHLYERCSLGAEGRVGEFSRPSTPSISMGSILSESPFNPEESIFSQLPFFNSEDPVEACTPPPRPSSICQGCWEGIFAIHFGLPHFSQRSAQWYQSWPEKLSYKTTVPELRSRGEAGCIWCRYLLREARLVLYRSMLPHGPGPLRVRITVRGTVDRRDPMSRTSPRLDVEIDGSSPQNNLGVLFVYSAPEGPAASHINARGPVLDVGSLHALALAKKDIDECIHQHESCKRSAPRSPRLPTRLIDCADLARPRLVSTANGGCGEYVALSYVWGGDQVHKTTTSNISMYEQGIPPPRIPATIRDAIYITRTLGLRWLWVDSLCIVQDSDEDKVHQIGRMHHIYRYAHLTIVAGDTENADDSFLHERPALQHIDFHDEDDMSGGVFTVPFICPPSPAGSVGDTDDHPAPQPQIGEIQCATWDEVEKWSRLELGRITTRAWCMQEYLMSPRSLVFTSKTLHLRCLTATQAVGNAPSLAEDTAQIPDALFLQDPPAAEPGSQLWHDVHGAWSAIVEDYTSRTASVESDKLVACAAVAQQFHQVLRSDYLAGMWRDTLLTDLLWRRHWELTGLGRPTSYRAPSWSWAAVEGRIQTERPEADTTVLAEIVECQITPKDVALPFGEVTGGVLVLRETLLPCHRHEEEYEYDTMSFILPSLEQTWGLDSSNGDEDGAEWTESGHSYAVTFTIDCQCDEEVEPIWAAPLVVRTGDGIQGLVLALAGATSGSGSRHENNIFRKIGTFRSSLANLPNKAVVDALCDPLTRAPQDGEFPVEIRIV